MSRMTATVVVATLAVAAVLSHHTGGAGHALAAPPADPLEKVPLEVRAALAAAAPVAPETARKFLDPADPAFRPDVAVRMLQTHRKGSLYAAKFTDAKRPVTFSIVQFADAEAARRGFEAWKAEGVPPASPLGWTETGCDPHRRGGGLLGVAGAGFGTLARGVLGQWHFEVNVGSVEAGGDAESETAVARKQLKRLVDSAFRYRLFPHRLSVKTVVAGKETELSPGAPLPLEVGAFAPTSFTAKVEVVDPAGKPIAPASFKVRLAGPLARFAKPKAAATSAQEPVVEGSSVGVTGARGAVTVTWTFPALTDKDFAAAWKARPAGGGVSIEVEARFAAPQAGPPPS